MTLVIGLILIYVLQINYYISKRSNSHIHVIGRREQGDI